MTFCFPDTRVSRSLLRARSIARATALALSALAMSGCGSTAPTPRIPSVVLGSITINSPSLLTLERGYHLTPTATITNSLGAPVTVPLVWRSLNESVAVFDATGRLASLDTGVTTIFATSLNVVSPAVLVHVVWQGAAKIAPSQFSPPGAVTPGATTDSIRALVTDLKGAPVLNARVSWTVTAGGGSVSPAIATTNDVGVASAVWTLGAVAGVNKLAATVLGENDVPFSFVIPNQTTYSLRSFAAVAAIAGDAQTATLLSKVPVNPSIRLVDSTGAPRPGVPVTFTATGGGSVALSVVSTNADGTASPGAWTLGDTPGNQDLIARVEFATVVLHANATGTAVHYKPQQLAAGGFATCAINSDGSASCWGEQPKVGDSSGTNKSTPTPVKSSATFLTVSGAMASTSHYCGVSSDQSIYCWGVNALADTSGKTTATAVPTRVASALAWTDVAAGGAHNCALGTDQNIYCWGDNSVGQLGDRTTAKHFVPAPVFGGFKFASVGSGAGHSCGLTTGGSAFCWGLNQNGQLGDASTSQRVAPTAVVGALNFQKIATGESWTCGLTTTGRAYCWGNLGAVGTAVSTPRTYASAPIFTSLTVGGAHACALTADGTAYCWGNNVGGQIGDSTLVDRPNPVPVVTTMKFKSISAGYVHTCGITTDGSVACWGLNRAGELGDSTAANRLTPRYMVLSVTP